MPEAAAPPVSTASAAVTATAFGKCREAKEPQCSSTVTDSMTTRSFGDPERVPTASMAATTSSPFTTAPKSEYCGGNRAPSGPDDEELAAVRVRAGVGHRERA